jgi:hypothetical protein
MYNATCCALKLHAKSQFNGKVNCDKEETCLVDPYNRNYFLAPCGCRQCFAGLPHVIMARFSATRHYAARRTR